MPTAAFRSSSRRPTRSSETNNNNNVAATKRITRSQSVSAVSRRDAPETTTTIVPPDVFLNKRDNPLFWSATGGGGGGDPPSPENEAQEVKILKPSQSLDVGRSERGRSVAKKSQGKSEWNSNGRRGRSVSRPRASAIAVYSASESEGESTVTGRKPTSVGNSVDACSKTRSLQPSSNSVMVPSNPRVPSWEDGISNGSLSEAEEKTIRAVYEQMKSFHEDNLVGEAATIGIYETVRSEVRRAISDIQNDIGNVIRRNNSASIASADVADIHPDLVKPGAIELVLDIRREYAKKLEESGERARKLRSDLAVEELRGEELSRILKETVPDPKASSANRSRLVRRKSNERKSMSKRLTDEALSYFDECVSISTFDSSDFSAAEDSSLTLGGTTCSPQNSTCISTSCRPTNFVSRKQLIRSQEDPSENAIHNESVIDNANEREKNPDRKLLFSFAQPSGKHSDMRQDIRHYITDFKKDIDKDGVIPEALKSNHYDVDDYDQNNHREGLLFDKVFLRNRIESGSLHLCGGGIEVPFLPFASII